MKSQNNFSILISINASRAINNEAEIFVRVTLNQKRAKISLKRKIDMNSWDKNKYKGNSQQACLNKLFCQSY
ncbi:Phage integrase SAM-like domain-containing protein [Lutibacter agarilyticus]|uniref:Phage integrase SAM-like domain-containing protein n=1 Tax=Lutibacter agarilyticus TaxID=1109740 RepID=A0A238Z5Y6_9FLAO|nr:Phage integrase SAM-like domain-containing protein [Lutibacter agarilyticus]